MFTQLVFKWLCLLLFCCSLSVTVNWESSCFWTIGWTVAVICTAPVGLWETVMSIYLKNNHQDLSMMKIIFSCIPIPKPPIRLRLGWNLKATTWLISFSYSSQHSLTSRDETEPINPACVQITKLDKNVCWGFAERARRSCLHHRVHTKAYCKWRKVWLPVCVYVWCVCARCVCVRCRLCQCSLMWEETVQPTLKKMSQIIPPPTHVPYPCLCSILPRSAGIHFVGHAISDVDVRQDLFWCRSRLATEAEPIGS